MKLFGQKKKEKKADEKKPQEMKTAVAAPKAVKAVVAPGVKDVLLKPRVTEKAANLTSKNVYTFDVRKNATKKDIAAAVVALYKVTPVKVRIVNSPSKRVAMRRKRGFGVASGVKKAYVFLKDGDSITFT